MSTNQSTQDILRALQSDVDNAAAQTKTAQQNMTQALNALGDLEKQAQTQTDKNTAQDPTPASQFLAKTAAEVVQASAIADAQTGALIGAAAFHAFMKEAGHVLKHAEDADYARGITDGVKIAQEYVQQGPQLVKQAAFQGMRVANNILRASQPTAANGIKQAADLGSAAASEILMNHKQASQALDREASQNMNPAHAVKVAAAQGARSAVAILKTAHAQQQEMQINSAVEKIAHACLHSFSQGATDIARVLTAAR